MSSYHVPTRSWCNGQLIPSAKWPLGTAALGSRAGEVAPPDSSGELLCLVPIRCLALYKLVSFRQARDNLHHFHAWSPRIQSAAFGCSVSQSSVLCTLRPCKTTVGRCLHNAAKTAWMFSSPGSSQNLSATPRTFPTWAAACGGKQEPGVLGHQQEGVGCHCETQSISGWWDAGDLEPIYRLVLL